MGRPTLLTPERSTAIVAAARAGASPSRSANAGNVSKQAVLNWLHRGEAERQRLSMLEDAEPAPDEVLYLDFLGAMEKAVSDYILEGLEQIRLAGEGEPYEETVIVEKLGGWDGESRDANGAPVLHPVEQTVTVKKGTKKSWQAWAWLLERGHPDEFARLVKTELTGAEGGPVTVESLDQKRERARTLVRDDLAAKRQQKGIAPALDVESTVHDGELLPGEDGDEPPATMVEALMTGAW